MPIYCYRCAKCGCAFELLLVGPKKGVRCAKCRRRAVRDFPAEHATNKNTGEFPPMWHEAFGCYVTSNRQIDALAKQHGCEYVGRIRGA